ncbi:ABC transporter ATP-binding protein [Brucella thiophenivorans]|uniref:Oligopeptide/dipeptide ABC transporter, ATP-binding, C-terminal domain protein n=1 Tax=Brucella thiophenivorans TaxID=571255 RepID=A0A256F1U4_9HYPH|nr:ABC transporter ATP-binding protein [Brucella thiophenivorans]OYR08812.1 oligopeptide/dipeptide ABC transporter, ATP-binding, C-terminal domain protein [Brucella thiophenivorans]
MSSLLSVDNVTVRFRTGGLLSRLSGKPHYIEGVADASLSMDEGEIMALVGESGSGKTTLARSIVGLQKLSSGSVRFLQQDISGFSDRQMKSVRRDISMMFQDPTGSLSPRMKVGSLLAEPFRIHGIKGVNLRAEVRRLLSLVGLPLEFANRYPHQLSGGQARRIGVARSLALDPKLIIADEPTAGLDVSVQGEVLNLLRDLRDKFGLSVLIITHNLAVVKRVSERMAVMYLGRLVEQGLTAQIHKFPHHPYTAALLSSHPGRHADLSKRIMLPAEVPSLLARPSGCEFHTRCPFTQDRCKSEVPERVQTAQHGSYTCHFPLVSNV